MKRKKMVLLNPGPVNITETVRKALLFPDICHREKEYFDLMSRVRKRLVKVARGNKDYTTVIFTGSGTASVEAVISSVQGKLLNIINGDYGKRIKNITKIYNIKTVNLDYGIKYPDIKEIEDVLKKDKGITHISIIHHETTTGMLNPLVEVGKLSQKYKKTFIVDAVSSFGGEKLDVNRNNIDFCISSSNKCLQGVPGLSFVIARKTEMNKLKNRKPRSLYLNLYNQWIEEEKNGIPLTPAVQAFYALDRAIDELFKEGLDNRIKRFTLLSKTMREGLIGLGFKILVPENQSSHILMSVIIPKGFSYNTVHDRLNQKGYTIYAGKSALKNNTFRVANIGDLNKTDIDRFIKVLKSVLGNIGK